MALILYIETATPICSTALSRDGILVDFRGFDTMGETAVIAFAAVAAYAVLKAGRGAVK